jgi:DNA-directed RNA polymerase specialized sigma subunit
MSRSALKQLPPELKEYLNHMPLLSLPEEWKQRELLGRMRQGDAEAKRQLAEGYLPLVVKWVSPFRGGILTFQQLIERGNQAMVQALDPFKGNSGDELGVYLEKTVIEEIEGSLKILKEKQL